MSDHVTSQTLEAECLAIQAEISSNLKEGKPTRAARLKLADVQSRLKVVRNKEATLASTLHAGVIERANTAGRNAATGAIADIGASISHLAAAGAPEAAMASVHPAHALAIEQAASALALVEGRHAEVAELHANAEREVADVEAQLADALTQHAEIVAARRAGDKTEAQEARLYALSTDIAGHKSILEQLRAAAVEVSPHASAREVSTARANLERKQQEARVALLSDHLTLLSRTMESALREAEAAGRAIGKSLHAMWQPSPALRQALSTGTLPALPRVHGG
jgi:hypothetical protein